MDMDKLNALISLNEAKKTIDELILKIRQGEEESDSDTRKLLIIILSAIGALVVIGVIAFFVYRHFCKEDEYDDLDELFEEDEDEEDEDDPAEDGVVSEDDLDE